MIEVKSGESFDSILALLKEHDIDVSASNTQRYEDQPNNQNQGSEINIKFNPDRIPLTEKNLCVDIRFARFIFDSGGKLVDLEQWSELCVE